MKNKSQHSNTGKANGVLKVKPNGALTPTEEAVYESMIANPNYGKVSEELEISVNTVKTHVKKIFRKMKVNSHVELVQQFLRTVQQAPVDVREQKLDRRNKVEPQQS